MKSIGVVLAVLVVLAMVAKDYTWRVRGLVLALLITMIILMIRSQL
ncbi:MAG TPA: hypothetical protein VE338_00495 [Ktedonobacterales bacterium]|jgi:hypothetical protein|nr:hypothetical protein [Ktedonobacterales bacterium]